MRADYKQTLCTLLWNLFARHLNGRLDRPWDHEKHPTWKPSSAHQGNSADTWSQKERSGKKISRSPQRSPWVILRERNLCDIDRIVHKRRRCTCACTNTHNCTSLLSLGFLGVWVCWALKLQQKWWMSGCPLSLFYSTRLNGPFTDSSEIDGKTTSKKWIEALSLFSGLQPQSALSTPNILHAVKPPVKICFSLPHIAGQSLRSWKSDSGWKAPSETSHSSPLTIISQSFSFSSFDRMFSCQAKHVIPFKLCP